MPDISEVEQTIVDLVAGALYPNGYADESVVGPPCRIYRGWPSVLTLNADLAADIVNVTIVSDNDSGRVTTRYLDACSSSIVASGATISVSQGMISLGGCPKPGDLVGALLDKEPFVYRVVAGDTPELVASNLCHLIKRARLAATTGSTIDVPNAHSIIVRAVGLSIGFLETRRQEKDVRISCWCSTPIFRDAVATAIDAAINRHSFIPFPDGSSGRIFYKNSAAYDQAQSALLYRRDLTYNVEYPTISKSILPTMLFGDSRVNGFDNFG